MDSSHARRIATIRDQQCVELVDHLDPRKHNIISTKWIYRNKQDENGQVVRNQSRLVAQGYTQVDGIDFGETFAPVAWLC